MSVGGFALEGLHRIENSICFGGSSYQLDLWVTKILFTLSCARLNAFEAP